MSGENIGWGASIILRATLIGAPGFIGLVGLRMVGDGIMLPVSN